MSQRCPSRGNGKGVPLPSVPHCYPSKWKKFRLLEIIPESVSGLFLRKTVNPLKARGLRHQPTVRAGGAWQLLRTPC
jgi:hypothetical protein